MKYPALAITHIHTRASNGPASELDPVISKALKDVLGKDTQARWSECFTRVEQLTALLDPRVHAKPVDIICVTDHANWRAHKLPEDLLEAAAADPRLCVGSEVATVDQDVDGVYRVAPEVLVYGGTKPSPHTGLNQAQLDGLFQSCRAPGRFEPQTRRVMDYCAERGWAYALAHPMDGHQLSVDKTFEIIGRAPFIETVNGGFPVASTELLETYLWLHNQLALGRGLPAELWNRYPYLQQVADRIHKQRLKPIVALGGSDAHAHDFDRVLVRLLSDKPHTRAVDLLTAMTGPSTEELLAEGTFAIVGRPGTALSVLDDVLRIVGSNIWANRSHMLTPWTVARVLGRSAKVVHQELGQRDQRQKVFLAEARRVLPHGREGNQGAHVHGFSATKARRLMHASS